MVKGKRPMRSCFASSSYFDGDSGSANADGCRKFDDALMTDLTKDRRRLKKE